MMNDFRFAPLMARGITPKARPAGLAAPARQPAPPAQGAGLTDAITTAKSGLNEPAAAAPAGDGTQDMLQNFMHWMLGWKPPKTGKVAQAPAVPAAPTRSDRMDRASLLLGIGSDMMG